MNIFVTGATGVVGRRAVPLLLQTGHRVTAAGRSPQRLSGLARQGASTLTLDLFDREAVRRGIAGHEAIINLATHIPQPGIRVFFPGAWKETGRIREHGSALLVDEALASGTRLFVQESFAPTYPDSGDRWITEEIPLQPANYNKSTVAAEAVEGSFCGLRSSTGRTIPSREISARTSGAAGCPCSGSPTVSFQPSVRTMRRRPWYRC